MRAAIRDAWRCYALYLVDRSVLLFLGCIRPSDTAKPHIRLFCGRRERHLSAGLRLCRATGGFSSSPLWRRGSVSRGLACFPDNGLDGFAGACLQGSRVPRRCAPRPRRLPASRVPRVHARNPPRARRMTSQTSRHLSPIRMLSDMSGRCSGCASRIVIQGADGRSDLPQTASSSDHARSQAECRRAKAPVTWG